MSLDFDLVTNPCAHCLRGDERIEFNMTHNVSLMWRHAGCYEALYESDGRRAREVLMLLVGAVDHMAAHSEEYEPMNPPNGWGSYHGALSWLREVTAACASNPDALIQVSR